MRPGSDFIIHGQQPHLPPRTLPYSALLAHLNLVATCCHRSCPNPPPPTLRSPSRPTPSPVPDDSSGHEGWGISSATAARDSTARHCRHSVLHYQSRSLDQQRPSSLHPFDPESLPSTSSTHRSHLSCCRVFRPTLSLRRVARLPGCPIAQRCVGVAGLSCLPRS